MRSRCNDCGFEGNRNQVLKGRHACTPEERKARQDRLDAEAMEQAQRESEFQLDMCACGEPRNMHTEIADEVYLCPNAIFRWPG